MNRISLGCLATVALMLAACSDNPTGPLATKVAGSNPGFEKGPVDKDLVIYTQNVYIGANVDAVLASPPDQIQNNLFAALGTFVATDWPERAAAMADFIGRERPDLIALNEVSDVTVQGLAPFFPDLHVEFLPVLQAALAARHLEYVVGGVVANVDAQINLGGPSIRQQDFDVVLVRKGISISNVRTHNYAAHVVVPVGGIASVDLVRGWVSVDATENGRTVRFVASHLEPQETSLPLQLAQSQELIANLADSPYPVIIASDLNSDPLDPAPMTSYDQFIAAGFQDAWLERTGNKHESGFTCCENPDLLNPLPVLTKRIDLVLVRPEGKRKEHNIKPVEMTLFGDQAREKTVNGLWPSDHAGVLATMQWDKIEKK